MSFWDAHSHLADPRLDSQRDAWLDAARSAGIGAWVQGGVNPEDWERQLLLKARWAGQIITAFGLHPWWIASSEKSQVEAGWKILEHKISEADALGETGLDHARDRKKLPTYDLQCDFFERQVNLAKASRKPLILHIVQAHREALLALRSLGPFPARGIVHSFCDTFETAKAYIDLGLLISVGADATRAQPAKILSCVKRLPGDSLVVETDCPDQSPFEGLRRRSGLNQPVFLLEMADAVGRLRGENGVAVLERSTENLKRVFDV